jgi:hypothetical protein
MVTIMMFIRISFTKARAELLALEGVNGYIVTRGIASIAPYPTIPKIHIVYKTNH